METAEYRLTVVTNETPASAPARRAALEAIADMNDRQLALFHFLAAQELLSPLEHEVRDYGDDESPFTVHEKNKIYAACTKIRHHLQLMEALAIESCERERHQNG